MIFKTYINDLHLSEGESVRSDCPSCKGRKTFTATKMDGKIIYNCYKLGCGTKGVESVGYNKREIGERLSRIKDETPDTADFVMPEYVTHDVSNWKVQKFIQRWDLKDVYFLYDVRDERVVFPIRDKRGKLIDAVGRALSYNTVKWLRYSGKADYYLSGVSKSCAIVVEDVISAITVSNTFNVTGVAILGTSLNLEHKKLLSTYDTVLVALDPDASNKTLQYTIDLRNYVNSVKAVSLLDDIKYKKDTDVETIRGLI